MEKDLSRYFWENHPWEFFKTLDISKTVAVLPISAIEQHGPHLPLATDRHINDAILCKALEKLDPDITCLILPHQTIGRSIEHDGYAGTLTLSTHTAMSLWNDIARSVQKSGIRKMLFFNSHGGNADAMNVVGRDIRIEYDLYVSSVSWFDFGYPDDMFCNEETAYGWHGGDIETSLMLSINNTLVDMSKAKNFFNAQQVFPKPLGKIHWKAEDTNEAGVTGNAENATAEKGHILLNYYADKLAKAIENFSKMPLQAAY